MFEYFYHEILRKTVISFGTLFNGMTIKHTDSSDDVVSEIKVPLAYGPMQKFLARLEQSPDLNKPVQISLPRMSFEFIGLNYDPSRKVTTTQTFITANTANKTQEKKVYMPVPYNMQFELNILTKLNDDMLQIVEQILPYFQPSFNLSVNLISEIGEKRDIPIVLDSITMNDDYEGDFSTRRALIYTLRFTAKHICLVQFLLQQQISSKRFLLVILQEHLVLAQRLLEEMLPILLNLGQLKTMMEIMLLQSQVT